MAGLRKAINTTIYIHFSKKEVADSLISINLERFYCIFAIHNKKML